MMISLTSSDVTRAAIPHLCHLSTLQSSSAVSSLRFDGTSTQSYLQFDKHPEHPTATDCSPGLRLARALDHVFSTTAHACSVQAATQVNSRRHEMKTIESKLSRLPCCII